MEYTRADLIALRDSLGMNPTTFAAVTGIGVATLYVPETDSARQMKLSNHAKRLLAALRWLVDAEEDPSGLGERLETLVALHGPLYAVNWVLTEFFERGGKETNG